MSLLDGSAKGIGYTGHMLISRPCSGAIARLQHYTRQAFISLALAVLAGGCTTVSESSRVTAPEMVDFRDAEPDITAADLLRQADRAQGQTAASYRMQAARLLWDQGNTAQAKAIVESIDSNELNDALAADVLLLQAEIAIADEQAQEALTMLRPRSFPSLNGLVPEQRIRYHELRAQALHASAQMLESALERIELDRLLDAGARAANHELIWQALATLPQARLESLAAASLDYEVQGWYQLALVGKAHSNNLDRQLVELQNWRNVWTRHPAVNILPQQMALAETMARQKPQRLALLLPLESQAGIIVRDAFLSAYFTLQELGGQVPALRFYDTSNETDILALHRKAREEGAQMIIGPLQKQHVATLQGVADLGVPTLALNSIEGVAPASPLLFQFALSPETEARQLAIKAWEDGHRHAAILSPLEDIGNDTFTRKRDSFVEQWLQLGGSIVAEDTYRDNYTDTIADLLELDASNARMEDVRELVGKPLQFVQHRRQDVDFIYLIAQPGPARQIVPSLAYLYAGDIPVYASQDVYSGAPAPLQDRDINGVVFGDSPWLLQTAPVDAAGTREQFPMTSAPLLRLQAFGMDAFRLYPRLDLLASSPESTIPGASGTLSLGPNQTIERKLSWAKIDEGLVQPVE